MLKRGDDFWIDHNGDCLLAGEPGSGVNPIRLPDEVIAEILTQYPQAQESFKRLFPTMNAAERARLSLCYSPLVKDHITVWRDLVERAATLGVRPMRG